MLGNIVLAGNNLQLRMEFLNPIKSRIKQALLNPSLDWLSRSCNPDLSCIMYHRVTSGESRAPGYSVFQDLGVTLKNFDSQISHLSRNFECLSVEEAFELRKKGELPPKSVVVTFDDGYKDNLHNALPVLEKYRVPATVFVCTGLVDRCSSLWWHEHDFIIEQSEEINISFEDLHYNSWHKTLDEKRRCYLELNEIFKRMNVATQVQVLALMRPFAPKGFNYDDLILDWKEVRELAAHPLITIGAHTVNHPVLSRETSKRALWEMRSSKQRLELELERPVDLFAFPFGESDHAGKRESVLAESAGFKNAFSTVFGHLENSKNYDMYSLPRVNISHQQSYGDFLWKLSGLEYYTAKRTGSISSKNLTES